MEELEYDPGTKIAQYIPTIEPSVSLVTGLVMAYQYIDTDGDSCWGFYGLPSQGSVTANGLADLAIKHARSQFDHEGGF